MLAAHYLLAQLYMNDSFPDEDSEAPNPRFDDNYIQGDESYHSDIEKVILNLCVNNVMANQIVYLKKFQQFLCSQLHVCSFRIFKYVLNMVSRPLILASNESMNLYKQKKETSSVLPWIRV